MLRKDLKPGTLFRYKNATPTIYWVSEFGKSCPAGVHESILSGSNGHWEVVQVDADFKD